MRIECRCGERLKVGSADAGRNITCSCGNVLEVPSLRQLQQQTPERLLAETFQNPSYWAARGCYLCGEPDPANRLSLQFELQQAEYKRLPAHLGPAAILALISPWLALGWVAANSHDRVLVKEPVSIEISLMLCPVCAAAQDVTAQCFNKLTNEYGRELLEDYPEMRVYSPNSR